MFSVIWFTYWLNRGKDKIRRHLKFWKTELTCMNMFFFLDIIQYLSYDIHIIYSHISIILWLCFKRERKYSWIIFVYSADFLCFLLMGPLQSHEPRFFMSINLLLIKLYKIHKNIKNLNITWEVGHLFYVFKYIKEYMKYLTGYG